MSNQPNELLLKDLEAYENPAAFADPQKPHVYRLNIPGKPYDPKGAVLRIELDGTELKSSLRALMSVALNRYSKEDLEQYLASTPYQQSENDMYVFFLRHFPNLMTDFFITLSQIALVSPGSAGSLTFSGEDRTSFERAQKDLLEANLKRLRKKIKEMLRTRKQGAPPKTPQQRNRDRAEYLAKARAAYQKKAGEKLMRVGKTDVARELGIGGDPKRGGQSALQVFSKKLKALNISWNEIVAETETEVDK